MKVGTVGRLNGGQRPTERRPKADLTGSRGPRPLGSQAESRWAAAPSYGGQPFVLVPDLSAQRAPAEEWEMIERQGMN